MNRELQDAVIVAYGRSPVCKAGKGSLAQMHPIEFGYQVLKGVLEKVPQLKPEEIDDLVVGCACPGNETGWNMAKLLVNRARLPERIPGQTINRYCSSSLQAVATCANAIMCGENEVMVAGGIEYMSMTAPFNEADKFGDPWLLEHDPAAYMPMGETAENVAERCHVTRQEMEEMAVESNKKAYAAQQQGGLNEAIIPIKVTLSDGTEKIIFQDEGIRPDTNPETLSKLRTVFKENGTVTAATSSQTSDGASFAILMSAKKAKELGIKPIARFVTFAAEGCSADVMGLGPIYAVPKALKRAGLTVEDMDVIELNEAFAAQAIPCIRELKLPKDKVNPWGGAMALGHPMGATGIFLLSKALDYLRLHGGKYAMVTMCIGGGQGACGIFEML